MKQLKFSNPTFSTGLNLTVRKGVKWSLESGEVYLTDCNGAILGEAVIVNTMAMPFYALTSKDCEYEHDPHCRNYSGLFAELNRVYPAFDEREIVSLVFFALLNSDKNPETSVAKDDASSTDLD